MTLRREIAWPFVLIALLVLRCLFGADNGGHAPLTAQELVLRMESEFTHLATRETNGSLAGLSVPSKYSDDRSLQLISEIASIRKLKINGPAIPDSPTLTPGGIAYLGRMTNLARLEFICFTREGLPAGVISNASRLRQLRELELYFSESPAEEYNSITNMMNLTSLEVAWCPNFGDRELQIVTNLPQLRKLVLVGTSVTQSGTNILRGSSSISNLIFVTKDKRVNE